MSNPLRASLIAIALIAASGQTACFGGGPSPNSLRKSPEFQLRPPGSAVLAERDTDQGVLGRDASVADLVGSKMDTAAVVAFFEALAAERHWPEVELFLIDGFQYANAWRVGDGRRLSLNVGKNSQVEKYPAYATLFHLELSAPPKQNLDESIKPTTATIRPR